MPGGPVRRVSPYSAGLRAEKKTGRPSRRAKPHENSIVLNREPDELPHPAAVGGGR